MEVDSATAPHCEHCDYNLTGLTAGVCPECGSAFDPRRPWVSGVPWARRVSIGRARAYWLTLVEVTMRPERLAREAMSDDAKAGDEAVSFRAATVRASSALIGVLLAVGLGVSTGRPGRIPLLLLTVAPLGTLVTGLCMHGTIQMLREVRIPRGRRRVAPLAPPGIFYTAAPLIFAPLVGVVGCFALPALGQMSLATGLGPDLAGQLATVGALAVMLVCWINLIRMTWLTSDADARTPRLVQAVVVIPLVWGILGGLWFFLMGAVVALGVVITG